MKGSFETSIVRIRARDGYVVGAGFLVGARHVLTCAHVIAQALHLAHDSANQPQELVSLDFPLISPHTLLTSRVVLWCPPQADGRGDIAGLELQDNPPAGAEQVRFASAEDVWGHPFRAFGFPSGQDDGVWASGRLLGRQATDWLMIEDVKAPGFAIVPGFSGTPVWDTRLQGVIGMIVAASRPEETKTAFVLPLDVLLASWPLIDPLSRLRVFLSSAAADRDFSARLASDLQERGVVVWSEQQLPCEENINKEERVRQAIRAALAVILVVSKQTRSSKIVREHLRLGDLYQRRLILVWIGDDEYAQPHHYGWHETTWIDTHQVDHLMVLEVIEDTLNQRRSLSALFGSADVEEVEAAPRNPYKGLHAFTASDVHDFFGRDRLVAELINDIKHLVDAKQEADEPARLLTLIGPSGSGKSSVLMAGILPRLQQGAVPESETWVYLEPIVPGRYPIESLCLALAPHFPGHSISSLRMDLEDDSTRGLHVLAMQLAKQRNGRIVLSIDQFEELFTQTESQDERQQFIDLLLTASTERNGPLLVLLTMRADFYDRPMQYPALSRLMQAHVRQVLPMEVEDLRAVIEQPARLPDVQLTFEGNLIGDILFAMQGQVGALPLLQFTLEQLFQSRVGHHLTLQAYHEIGGVKGALSQYAERTYAALSSDEQRTLARALFVRLIEPGTSEQDTTRRRAALSEFTLEDAEQTRILYEVMDTFIAARLLTTNNVAGRATLEVSHEALIREWKRLADWMHEVRQDIPLQQTISKDVTEWEKRGKPKDRLYRGTQLKEARAWATRNLPSSKEVAFLRASVTQHVRSLASIVVVMLLLLASLGGSVWLYSLLPNPNLVTNTDDSGPGSLRLAIEDVPTGSTIRFDTKLEGKFIKLRNKLDIKKI